MQSLGRFSLTQPQQQLGKEDLQSAESQFHHVVPLLSVLSLASRAEEKYVTLQPYTSQGKDEVSFEKGVTVEVIQKNLEGWWFIRSVGTHR